MNKRFNKVANLFELFRRLADAGMSFPDGGQVSSVGAMGRVVGMITLTLLTFFAPGADIRWFVQFATMAGLIYIA